MPPERQEVEIVRIGAGGDGVAETGRGPVFVPLALPGERWAIDAAGGAAELVSEGQPRATPPCRHFGQCGGCIAQHMPDDVYVGWKRALVVDAFAHRGIAADVTPVVRVPLRSRRRAFLGVERRGQNVTIGFREEGRHKLVAMAECPVLDDTITAALPHLCDMARIAMPDAEGGRLIVTKTDDGLDVSFDNGSKGLPAAARAALASLAERARLVRLTVRGEPIVERGRAIVTIDGVAVEAPQSIFLQAVAEAERQLISLVMAAVPKKAKRAADLFSGLGTFALPVARRLAVTAFDSDKRAISALTNAAKGAQGLKPIDARVRDLFREPLSVRELDAFDLVVFDPPRAGAAEQAERLAKSRVPVVVAVSCAPATLARDARTLLDGGYRMGRVTPIDQFLFSAHVEAVAVFAR